MADREILFRGKRIDNDEWIEGYLARDAVAAYNIKIVNARGEYEAEYTVDPATVGQYTGLTDKNGRRIFEGDICLYTNGDGEQAVYSIFWGDCGWEVQMHADYQAQPDNLDKFFADSVEVIGNIYDNPELIGGQNG